MRDHDALRQARGSRGVAEECGLTLSLALCPFQTFDWRKRLALLDQLGNGLIWNLDISGVRCREFEDVDVLLRDIAGFGCFLGVFKQWNAGLNFLEAITVNMVDFGTRLTKMAFAPADFIW